MAPLLVRAGILATVAGLARIGRPIAGRMGGGARRVVLRGRSSPGITTRRWCARRIAIVVILLGMLELVSV